MTTTYKIVRMYQSKAPAYGGHLSTWRRTIKRGLTLKAAQAHCRDPETSSQTATGRNARRVTERNNAHWFDGYEEETTR